MKSFHWVSRLGFIGSQVGVQSSRFSLKKNPQGILPCIRDSEPLVWSLLLLWASRMDALWNSEFCRFPVSQDTTSHLTPPTYTGRNLWGSVAEPWLQMKWTEGWPNCSPVLLYTPQAEYPFWTQPSLDSAHWPTWILQWSSTAFKQGASFLTWPSPCFLI